MLNEYPMWEEDLPLYAKQNREVFARFGLAMYYAQCLEKQIGLMLATMYNKDFFRVPLEQRDSFYDKELAKTLGRLKDDLNKVLKNLDENDEISSMLMDELYKAVKLRNWLAHNYFYEYSMDILDSKGRERMIAELQEKADFFQNLDKEFTDIHIKWARHRGISVEDIEYPE